MPTTYKSISILLGSRQHKILMTILYNRYQNHEFTTTWPTNKHYFKLHFTHYLCIIYTFIVCPYFLAMLRWALKFGIFLTALLKQHFLLRNE